ncbi:MAG: hypothetical protein M1819_003175 [Sarea resinae]|nr:MAG: hypothetical protein M1819_003175 [Sarea resinae]
MVVSYTIAGRQFGSHVLAMITLGATAGIATLSLSGGEKKKEQGPPINATSPEEENFIQDFIKKAEAEAKEAKH